MIARLYTLIAILIRDPLISSLPLNSPFRRNYRPSVRAKVKANIDDISIKFRLIPWPSISSTSGMACLQGILTLLLSSATSTLINLHSPLTQYHEHEDEGSNLRHIGIGIMDKCLQATQLRLYPHRRSRLRDEIVGIHAASTQISRQ